MVHGQRLLYASRRPVDLNATNLRRRLEQARDDQRRTHYTLPQETPHAPQAAEGRPRDWDIQGGAEEQRRGLRACMGPSPPREKATGQWDPLHSLGTRRVQARAPMDRDTIRPIPQQTDRPHDFAGNVLQPPEHAPPVTVFRRILDYSPPFVSTAAPLERDEEGMRTGTGSSGDGCFDGSIRGLWVPTTGALWSPCHRYVRCLHVSHEHPPFSGHTTTSSTTRSTASTHRRDHIGRNRRGS